MQFFVRVDFVVIFLITVVHVSNAIPTSEIQFPLKSSEQNGTMVITDMLDRRVKLACVNW